VRQELQVSTCRVPRGRSSAAAPPPRSCRAAPVSGGSKDVAVCGGAGNVSLPCVSLVGMWPYVGKHSHILVGCGVLRLLVLPRGGWLKPGACELIKTGCRCGKWELLLYKALSWHVPVPASS